MLAATIEALVQRNEESVRQALAALPDDFDPIDRATRALANAFAQPAYLAELELWAVARTNPTLRTSLRAAERRARRDFERVVGELFSPLRNRPAYAIVVALSVEFLRGLALTGVLRNDNHRRADLLDGWSWAVHALLERKSVCPSLSINKE